MKKIMVTTIFIFAFFHLTSCSHSEAKIKEYQSNDELVVLAHGLGRSDGSMWRLAQRLENAGYKVCRLDYATIGESIDDVLAETTKQIDACLLHAPKVHFVGHSLGGLVIRSYLQNNQHQLEKINIAEVVLIGTPNKGSELADHLSDSWLMEIGGGISRALLTGSSSLGNNLAETDVNIGIIAGTKSSSLTSEQFDGPNDGLVSVESTKLNSMSDFITIDVSHSMMRYNLDVAEQTVNFLQNGKFQH